MTMIVMMVLLLLLMLMMMTTRVLSLVQDCSPTVAMAEIMSRVIESGQATCGICNGDRPRTGVRRVASCLVK